jgi:hypothetical protein
VENYIKRISTVQGQTDHEFLLLLPECPMSIFVTPSPGVSLLTFAPEAADSILGDTICERRFAPNGVSRMDLIPGILIGVVREVNDPDKLGRVQVLVPKLGSANLAAWAPVVRSYGVSNGALFAPESGDQVVVAFEAGDVRSPVVLGALWNPHDRPPTKKS